MSKRFTDLKRERLLALTDAGWSLTDAAAASEVSRQTVSTWLARGRHHPQSEAGEFAARFDAARAASPARRTERVAEPVPEDEVERRMQEGDPFLVLEDAELAKGRAGGVAMTEAQKRRLGVVMTAEQKRRARAVADAFDARRAAK